MENEWSMPALNRDQEQRIVELEKEISTWESFAEWVEHMSGKGQLNLTRSDFDDAVERGEWEIDD